MILLFFSWENPWKRRKNFSFPHLFKPTFFVISPFWVFLQLFLPNMENLRFFYSFQPSQFVNLSFHLLALICASVLVVVLMAYFLFEGSHSGFLWIVLRDTFIDFDRAFWKTFIKRHISSVMFIKIFKLTILPNINAVFWKY